MDKMEKTSVCQLFPNTCLPLVLVVSGLVKYSIEIHTNLAVRRSLGHTQSLLQRPLYQIHTKPCCVSARRGSGDFRVWSTAQWNSRRSQGATISLSLIVSYFFNVKHGECYCLKRQRFVKSRRVGLSTEMNLLQNTIGPHYL